MDAGEDSARDDNHSVQNLSDSLLQLELTRASSLPSEVELLTDDESRLVEGKPPENYDHGSDTSDEEEMEWRRQGLSHDEIFRNLEARKIKEHRDIAERRRTLLLGATSFAEFLDRHPLIPTLKEMIGDDESNGQQGQNDVKLENERFEHNDSDDRAETPMLDTVLEDSDSETKLSDLEVDETALPVTPLRRSTRVSRKPDRYVAPPLNTKKKRFRRRAATTTKSE